MLLLSVFFSSRILKEFSYLSLNFIEHDDVVLNCLMLKQWILSLSSKLVMFQPFKLKRVLLFQPVDLPPSEENGSTMFCSVFASHPSHLPSRENVGVPLPKKIPPTLETIFKWGVCTCKVFPDMWTYACRGIITICYLQQLQAAMGTRVACNWYTSIVKSWSISTTVPHQGLQWQPDKENVETLPTKNPGITKYQLNPAIQGSPLQQRGVVCHCHPEPNYCKQKNGFEGTNLCLDFCECCGRSCGRNCSCRAQHDTWWQTTHILNPGNSCNLIFEQPPLRGDFRNEGMVQTLLQE